MNNTLALLRVLHNLANSKDPRVWDAFNKALAEEKLKYPDLIKVMAVLEKEQS